MPLYQVGGGGASSPTDLNQYFNLLTGVSTDQQVTVSQRIRAQLSGANTGSGGFVGQSSGPPTTGTFNAGDYTADAGGGLWMCAAGGSPGTWVAVGLMPISEFTTTATAASVTWNGLPTTFRHLWIACNAQSTATSPSTVTINMGLSTMTGTWMGCSTWYMNNGGSVSTADGSGVVSAPTFQIPTAGSSSTADFGGGMLVMPNYTGSTGIKTFQVDSMAYTGNGSTFTWQTTRRSGWIWRQATLGGLNLTLTPGAGSFATGSFFGLYGSS